MAVPNLSFSTVADASVYFSAKLYAQQWLSFSADTQQAALNDAAQIINRFPYIGIKTVSTQIHEWPRLKVYYEGILLDGTVVPKPILIALYEIAFALAKGIDPERELRNARVTSRGYSSVRTTYDTSNIADNLLYGVPSAIAWQYLVAFLDNTELSTIRLRRVD